ncbi:MAG: hypothetical protein O7H41_01790 [Planctomycetota bacterium]|nr:hypothetical protein [Planctomycetota bacterium]
MIRAHFASLITIIVCLPLSIPVLAFVLDGGEVHDAGNDIHGDPLPPGALGRFGTSRFCAAGQIIEVAISPDGSRIATAANTGLTDVIEVWEAPSGKKLLRLEDRREFGATVDFSPDGKSIVIGGTAKTFGLWDYDKGQRTLPFTGVQEKIYKARFLTGGDRVFAIDKDGSAGFWDAKTGEPVKSGADLSGISRPKAISPDGEWVVSVDRNAYIWSVKTGKRVKELHGGDFGISNVAFSLNGDLLATSSYRDSIRLWDIESGRERRVFSGETYLSVAISPDGKLIAGADGSHRVTVWDLSSGKRLHTFGPHHEAVVDLVFSMDGKTLVSVSFDDTIRLWDLSKGAELSRPEGHETGVSDAAFTSDGKTIISAGRDGTIRMWDVETYEQNRVIRAHQGGILDMALSHDGKTIATSDATGHIGLWQAGTGKRLHWLKGHREHVWSVAFSPDDKSLATGGGDRTARLWDVASGKEKARFTGHKEGIGVVAFSLDGKLLASGDIGYQNLDKFKIRIWDVATSEMIRVIRGNERRVTTLTFLPDGESLMSWGGDRLIRVWDFSSGDELYSLPLPGAQWGDVQISPDGQFAALSLYPPTLALMEMSTGLYLFHNQSRGDMRASGALAFSPDGEKLVSRNPSSALVIYDLPALAKAPGSEADLPDKETLSRLWSDLASEDGPSIFHAMHAIARFGDRVLPFLRESLDEEQESALDRAKGILLGVDKDNPAAQEQIAQELIRLGRWGAEAIREELSRTLHAEVRERLESILESMNPPYRHFPSVAARHSRLRWVLEKMGGDDARALAVSLEKTEESPVAGIPLVEGSKEAMALAEIRRLMRDGSWKKAIKKIKTYSKKHAETPEQSEEVARLQEEAEGRLGFEQIEAEYEKKKRARETAAKLIKLLEDYRGPPDLVEKAEALLETVLAKFVFMIEDYEQGRGSRVLMRRHPGYTLVKRPEPVKHGDHAGKWDPVAADSVTYTLSWVKSMDWSEYDELCLWIYNEKKARNPTKCRIVITTDPPPFAGHHDFWFTVDWVGWKELRVAMRGGRRGFRRQGKADWSKTERIMIHQSEGDKSVLYFDDVRLEKKLR